MLSFLEYILSPLTWSLYHLLVLFDLIFSSKGLSVIAVSVLLAVLLQPVRRGAQRLEKRVSDKIQSVALDSVNFKNSLKGEALFNAMEKVYQKHGYHPIQNVLLGTSFFIMLPVLVSALLLFQKEGVLTGESFLFIHDLSKPDGLLWGINVLPLLMTAMTVADATWRFKDDNQSRNRIFIIAIVLLFLVYNMPAGLVLFWTVSNLISFAFVFSGITENKVTRVGI